MKPDRHSLKSARSAQTLAGIAGALALACAPLTAQMHKVETQGPVVRAVAVYEWTGDLAKPTASRLIPVSLFIDGKLEDAADYLARPVPMALLTGNRYQLQKAGILQGNLDVAFSRHLVAAQTNGSAYDDGWFGYGKFSLPTLAKPAPALKGSATQVALNGFDEDDTKPHFSARSATPGSGGSANPTPGTAPAASGTPADDPDRPTLHRSGSSGGSDQGAGSGTSSSGSTPPDDPDRPTLRRRSAEEEKEAAKGDQPSVTSSENAMIDDPNRPVLHRGKPESALNEEDIPKLSGLPGEEGMNALHQMAAVSDAKDRDPHDFARPWEDDAEHQAILTKMETEARAALAAYEAANGVAPATPPPTGSSARSSSAAHRTTARKTAPPAPPPEALLDEQLTGYTLSYGGDATYVYHAHTDGLGPTLRFVTLVEQVDARGGSQIAIKNVTDAAHLDRTPRMRLVDAVDAEASNRASLLFELRAQNSRQFALYRVIGGRAEQTFLTGSTQ